MNNYSAEDFARGLSPELRERAKKCGSPDEFMELLDEHDIELPPELLEGVDGGRGFIQSAIAAVMMLTAAAPLSAAAEAGYTAPETPAIVLRDTNNNGSAAETDMGGMTEAEYREFVREAVRASRSIGEKKSASDSSKVTKTAAFAVFRPAYSVSPDMNKSTEDKTFDYLVKADRALIDTLADLIPGGKALTAPLSWLVDGLEDEYYDGRPRDAKEKMLMELGDQLDEMEGKIDGISTRIDALGVRLDDISNQISDVNVNVRRNIELTKKTYDETVKISKTLETDNPWIIRMNDNNVRMNDCADLLEQLRLDISDPTGLYLEVIGIEKSKDLTPEQKIVKLAELSHSEKMRDMSRHLTSIAGRMVGENTALTTNFFDTLLMYEYQNVMISSEVFDKVKESADKVAEEFLAGSILYLRCLEAEQALIAFDEDDCYRMGAEWVRRFAAVRETGGTTLADRAEAIEKNMGKALDGYAKFVKKNQSSYVYVDHGRYNIPIKAEQTAVMGTEAVQLDFYDGDLYGEVYHQTTMKYRTGSFFEWKYSRNNPGYYDISPKERDEDRLIMHNMHMGYGYDRRYEDMLDAAPRLRYDTAELERRNALSLDEKNNMVVNLAEYVRKTYPGMSMAEFLNKYMGVNIVKQRYCGYNNVYILTSPVQTRVGGRHAEYFTAGRMNRDMALYVSSVLEELRNTPLSSSSWISNPIMRELQVLEMDFNRSEPRFLFPCTETETYANAINVYDKNCSVGELVLKKETSVKLSTECYSALVELGVKYNPDFIGGIDLTGKTVNLIRDMYEGKLITFVK